MKRPRNKPVIQVVKKRQRGKSVTVSFVRHLDTNPLLRSAVVSADTGHGTYRLGAFFDVDDRAFVVGFFDSPDGEVYSLAFEATNEGSGIGGLRPIGDDDEPSLEQLTDLVVQMMRRGMAS